MHSKSGDDIFLVSGRWDLAPTPLGEQAIGTSRMPQQGTEQLPKSISTSRARRSAHNEVSQLPTTRLVIVHTD